MGQHKTNPNAQAVKRGELKPRVKAVKPLSKREAGFLERWAQAVEANRPGTVAEAFKLDRRGRRVAKRLTAKKLREINALAQRAIRERMKAARKAKAV